MVQVLDASALLAYLEKENGFEKVRDVFVKSASDNKNLLMTTVNGGEVYYIVMKEYGVGEAEKILRMMETFPIEFIPVDWALAQQAARYKAEKSLLFVDCMAAALAKLRKGELMTKDKDFKAVEGEIKIMWI